MADILEEKDEVVDISFVGEVHPAPFGENLNELHFDTKDGRSFIMWARAIPAIQEGEHKIHSLKCQKADKNKTIYWKCTGYDVADTPQGGMPVGTTGDGKNKSYALSYAKDIEAAAIQAGLVKSFRLGKVIETATVFEWYLNGDLTISGERIAKLIDAIGGDKGEE